MVVTIKGNPFRKFLRINLGEKLFDRLSQCQRQLEAELPQWVGG